MFRSLRVPVTPQEEKRREVLAQIADLCLARHIGNKTDQNEINKLCLYLSQLDILPANGS